MHFWWECRLGQSLWKAVLRYLKKFNINLLFDILIPLLGIFLKEPKTLIQKNISTSMFIAKMLELPKCPSANEWMKQLWDIYTMEYYSVVKKEESFTLCSSIDGPGEYYAK